MQRHLLPVALATLASTTFPVALAQDVAYEKYRLENGLTVILHEDHSLPQVHVNVWYLVGAKDEPPGRSGFAHLFEHLMFLGTQRVPEGEFDRIMEGGGGSNNASTSFDRTNYFDNGPAELLPTLLWLEADRMEALGPNMTQEKLDGEREVVRNERRQSFEDRPYGEAYLRSHELLYPADHPYHIPVIGTHRDLEAATVEDVKSFFAEFYVPSNASLVVAGDFDPQATRALITELFGSIPRGADVRHLRSEPVQLDEPVVYTMTDRVPFSQTNLIWHSPPIFTAGDAELDLVAATLADGVSSRLVQALVVERELAEEVQAFQSSRLLGSTFTIAALARDGVALPELEAAIDEVLVGFLESGPTAEEIERQQARFEARNLRRLQSIQAKADRLNLYEFHFGEPNSFRRDLDRYRQATPESCRRWAREVLGSRGRVVLRVLPAPPEPEVNPRDGRPEVLPTTAFEPSEPARFRLENGIEVLHWRRSELPLVEVSVLLPVGSIQDPPGRAGLARMVADMLDEGAGERSATAFADELDRLGASLSASVDTESTRLRLSALARNFEASLGLLADALLRPRFLASEWDRVHREQLSALELQASDPAAIARRASLAEFFGPEHPYGRPAQGDLESVKAIALGDLVEFYSETYRPEGVKLLVAGDVTREELEAALGAAFGGWRGLLTSAGRFPLPEVGEPANDRLRVVLVDRPGSVQTVVRFTMPAEPYTDPARPARELLTSILGGTFTSRLNQNLRVDKGITYGARAGVVYGPSAAYFVAQAQVQTEHTALGVQEFLAEFSRLRTGDVSTGEVEKARATRRLGVIRSFAGLSGLVGTAETLVLHGRTVADLAAELRSIAGLGADQLNAVAPALVPLERALLVLVGDGEGIRSQLEGLDLPPIEELDPSSRPRGEGGGR